MKRLFLALVLAACGSRPAVKPAPPPNAPAVPALVPPEGRLPREVAPLGYRVALAFEGERFAGSVAIEVALAEPARVVWLHAAGLAIDGASAVQGTRRIALRPSTTGDLLGLVPPHPLEPGEWVIEVAYRGAVAADGLAAQRIGEDRYLVTQLAPMTARRVVPCIDEPDRKVPWQLALDVAADDTVIANAAIARETTVAGKKHVELAPTAPIASHKVAFAIGPFSVVDAGRTQSGAALRIATPRGRAGDAAFAAKRTVRLVELAEEIVGAPHPYGKLDFVAAPGTAGYPGLVTFDARLLQGGWIAAVPRAIAAQWFGGYLTPRWWDDIWIAEGWSTYVADQVIAALGPDALERPLEGDEVPPPQVPGRVRVPDAETRTARALAPYLSGEPSRPVMAWLARYASPPAVGAMLRAFVQNHAGGVVTSDDLVAQLPDAQLRTALSARIDASDARDPVIDARVRCDGAHPEITLAIREPARWPIAPACVIYEQRGAAVDACVYLMPARTIQPETCPAWAVASERTPSVEPLSPPETLFAIAWPRLGDAERTRALSRAQGELALRMAERLFAGEATREIAAWHLLQFERFVPDASRTAFEAKIRTLTAVRVRGALARPHGPLANPNVMALAALAGDAQARAALVKLVPDPARVHPALGFALRIAVRFDPAIAPRLLPLVPARPSLAPLLREAPQIVKLVTESPTMLDTAARLELLSGGCSQGSLDEVARTSHREVPAAINRIRACMKARDGLAPAFGAWLKSKR